MKRTKNKSTKLTINWIFVLVGVIMFALGTSMMSGTHFNIAMTLVVASSILESIGVTNIRELKQ